MDTDSRQKTGISPRSRCDPAQSWAPAAGLLSRIKQDKRQLRQQWMKKLADAEAVATEEVDALFKSNNTPIHPYRLHMS